MTKERDDLATAFEFASGPVGFRNGWDQGVEWQKKQEHAAVKILINALLKADTYERERIMDDLGYPGTEGCGGVTIETEFQRALEEFEKVKAGK